MISVDNWLNETTRHAHVILPGLSPLEHAARRRPLLDVRHPLLREVDRRRSSADRRTGPTSGRLLLRLGGAAAGHAGPRRRRRRDGRPVHPRLGRRCSARPPGNPLTGRDPAEAIAALRGRGPERLVDLGIRLGPWGDQLGAPGGADPGRGAPASRRPRPGADLEARPARRRRRRRRRGRSSWLHPEIDRRRAATAATDSDRTRPRPGAHQPTAPAVEQLLAAQRAGPDPGRATGARC